jgi:hypothetical protein
LLLLQLSPATQDKPSPAAAAMGYLMGVAEERGGEAKMPCISVEFCCFSLTY